MDKQNNRKSKQRYTTIRQLGAGAFATVFLAHDEKLNRQVAVKVFRQHDNKEALIRFEREALICKELRHPNVIRIFDASIKSNKPNIVMEYIDAGNLAELIEETPLTIEQALAVTHQIGNALIYLHSLNILHRDLKPENIMIQKPFTAILMDFNLAFSDDFTMLTKEGFTVGTPRFMAPEVLLGSKASKSSEVFSLGLILYEILTNGVVTKENLEISDLVTRTFKKPSLVNDKISMELDEVVLTAVNKNPDQRYPSIEDLMAALTNTEKVTAITKADKNSVTIKTDRGENDEPAENHSAVSGITPPPSSFKALKIAPWLFSLTLIICFCLFIHLTERSRIAAPDQKKEHSFPIPETHRKLFKIAAACNKVFPDFHSFSKFVAEEKHLFAESDKKKNGKNERATTNHCNLLQMLQRQINKGTPFNIFVEYRFRLRKSVLKAKININHSAFLLLRKCNDLYWKELASSHSINPENVAVAHLIFNELWKEVRKDPHESQELIRIVSNAFFNLPEDAANSDYGKAFFHSLTLCRINQNKTFLSNSKDLFFLPAPYENNLLLQIRNMTDHENSATESTKQGNFINKCQNALASFHQFIKTSEIKKKQLRKAIMKRNNLGGFMYGHRYKTSTTDIENDFDELICSYVQQTDLSWCLMNLSENKEKWAESLMKSLRHCLTYLSYRCVHLRALDSVPMGEKGPGSIFFAKKYSSYWRKTAHLSLSQNELINGGRVISNLYGIMKNLIHYEDDNLDSSFIVFIRNLKRKHPLTALSLRILYFAPLKMEAPKLEKLRKAFHNLLKIEPTLSHCEYGGWAMIMSVISNRLFIDLKAHKLNEERTSLSLTLAKLVSKNGKGPNHWSTKVLKDNWLGIRNLKTGTIIHCYDAFLVKGKNIVINEPELSKELKIIETLKNLSKGDRLISKGGAISAVRLLTNKHLENKDLLINPLRYW